MLDFATAYHAIRDKEGRIYSDEVLMHLPYIGADHPLHEEWMKRKDTLERLLRYLLAKPAPLRILDLGCGNGWMSHYFAQVLGAEVVGMDLNRVELIQAERVFAHLEDLSFREGNVFDPMHEQFDIVTMGGSVQYFPDLTQLVGRLRELLVPDGEIHIFDSPFYEEKERLPAKLRSLAYYESMGFPELAACYFQPSLPEIKALGGELLYDPQAFGRRLQRKLLKNTSSPFTWWRLPKA